MIMAWPRGGGRAQWLRRLCLGSVFVVVWFDGSVVVTGFGGVVGFGGGWARCWQRDSEVTEGSV